MNSDQSIPLANLTYAEISRGTGISPSMLSRMFSNDPRQRRANPTLKTLLMLQSFIQENTGEPVTLDALAAAIR